MQHNICTSISVSPEFREFIPAAILRINYIFPDFDVEITENGLKMCGKGDFEIRRLEREVMYQIYREKIFQQTLPMRLDLYKILAM